MATSITLPTNELTEFDLPRVCVVTGATSGVEFYDVRFQWTPRWVMAFVVCALILYVILASVMTKRVKGKLPFTPAAFAAWRRNVKRRVLGVLGSVGLLIGATFALDLSELLALGLGVAAVACFVVTLVVSVKGKAIGVTCARIADGQITLMIPSAEAALALQEHLHGGAPGVAQVVGA